MTLVSQHTTCAWLRADPRLLNVETAIYSMRLQALLVARAPTLLVGEESTRLEVS